MRKAVQALAILAVILGGSVVVTPATEAALTRSVTVTGKVTNRAGQVITNGKISIEIVASPDGIIQSWMHRLGQRATTVTSAQGTYLVTLGIPDGFPQKVLYAEVRATKLGGPPFYLTEEELAPITGSGTSLTARGNFVLGEPLEVFNYGAFVSGTVRDLNNGLRLRGVPIDGLAVDADGQYLQLVPLTGSTMKTTLSAYNVNIEGATCYSITYKEVTLQSGQSYTVDFLLDRCAVQTAVVGEITNRATGKPIPDALVSLLQGNGLQQYRTDGVTDIFGHYELRVDDVNDDILELYTNGAFLPVKDPSAPYLEQAVNLKGRLTKGSVYQLDLSLVPK